MVVSEVGREDEETGVGTRDAVGTSCVGSSYACYALDYTEASFSFCEGYGWGDEISCVPSVHVDGPSLYASQLMIAILKLSTIVP